MIKPRQVVNLLWSLLCLASFGGFICPLSHGQDSHPSQTAGVEQTRTGAYRALAELSYQAFQKSEFSTAAKIARSLERTWDKGEENGGENAIDKLDHAIFETIDGSMDAFIQPIIEYSTKSPDPIAVKRNYDAFIANLKLADNLVSRLNGVERNRMGVYRALAELAYGDFKKGEKDTAAKAAAVLLLTWTKDEEHGEADALSKTNPTLFRQINLPLTDFVVLLFNRPGNPSDPTTVEPAYKKLLDALILGNSERQIPPH
jgi:hypothetical protein